MNYAKRHLDGWPCVNNWPKESINEPRDHGYDGERTWREECWRGWQTNLANQEWETKY